MINLKFEHITDDFRKELNFSVTDDLFKSLDGNLDAILKVFKQKIENISNPEIRIGWNIWLDLTACDYAGDRYFFEYDGENKALRNTSSFIRVFEKTKEEALKRFTKSNQVLNIEPYYEYKNNNEQTDNV